MIARLATLIRTALTTARGIPHRFSQRASLRLLAACVLTAGLAVSGYPLHFHSHTAPWPAQAQGDAANQSLYALIFSAQDKGDFDRADTLIAQLGDQRLLGYVLAQRYQDSRYHASTTELRDWLQNYADYPQARELLALAHKRGDSAAILAAIHLPEAPLGGAGSAARPASSAMPDVWYHGLAQWKAGDMAAASASFQRIAADEQLHDWQRAAGGYWTFRAEQRLAHRAQAEKALALAASYPDSFYGILASAQQGKKLHISRAMPSVPTHLWADAAVQRAAWLAALEREEDAEAELRSRFTRADDAEQAALVTIAAQLNLPNLQLRLAQAANVDAARYPAARYPAPAPIINAQNAVDPALLLAVAMHESAFLENARSGGGAVGMMQMLPSTARHVARLSGGLTVASADSAGDAALSIHERLNNRAMSARLGADYMTLLMREPAVGNNLIRLLAAYNAGPGTVKNWGATAQAMDDPLLYMESIPYPETHQYVLQVMTNLWMYQTLLGKPTPSLKQLTRDAWPTV